MMDCMHVLTTAPPLPHRYVLRTDAQITQMMDCRSPDAAQCFSLPPNATWEVGRLMTADDG